MKRIGRYWLMSLLAVSAVFAAEEAVIETPAEPVVETAAVATPVWLPPAIITFGDVDEQLALRAQQWTEQNLAFSVPLLDPKPTARFGSLDEVAQYAATLLETNRVGLVVLWRPTSDASNHGAHYPDLRVSVANLNAMFTPDTDAEKIERRVERQAIRGVCLLFGLEPSPNPFSAMFNYSNLEELDAIGRNLDPPWLKRVQEKAVALGIPLDPDSVYNMMQ